MHDEAAGRGDSRIDLNRCGTPLLEIVSQPDLRSSAEAKNYLTENLEVGITFWGQRPISVSAPDPLAPMIPFNRSHFDPATGTWTTGSSPDLVRMQGARCLAAYLYAGSGPGESTTDSFAYTMQDAQGATSSATVTVVSTSC